MSLLLRKPFAGGAGMDPALAGERHRELRPITSQG